MKLNTEKVSQAWYQLGERGQRRHLRGANLGDGTASGLLSVALAARGDAAATLFMTCWVEGSLGSRELSARLEPGETQPDWA